MSARKSLRALSVAAFVVAASSFVSINPAMSCLNVQAQTTQEKPAPAEAVAGRYAGLSMSPTEGDMPIKMEIKSEKGNLTGEVDTQFGKFPIVSGSYTDGQLKMKFMAGPAEGNVEGAYRDGRIVGSWSLGESGGTLDLKRVDATGATSKDDYWPPTIPRLTTAQWREDLQYLAKELPQRHKNAFHTITREQFARAVAALDASLPKLRDDQITVGLSRLMAMIGDGHTGLNAWEVYRYYPMGFYWFGDELRVTRTIKPYARALGTRVVRVGDRDLNAVQQSLSQLIPQGENEWYVRGASAGHLRHAEELHALGIVKNMERARFTFADDKGKRFTLELSPATVEEEKLQWLQAERSAPLYRQNIDEAMWFKYLPDAQTVYFNFKSYPDTPEFQQRVAALFKLIDANPTRRLVIDLRQNGGGDFTKGRELLIPGLKQRAFITKPGGLYVITGRTTFSAAMVNAVDFKKELHAILVGEPTGARPNSYSENRRLILPNSHLNVSYSIRFYQFSDAGAPSVMPDKRLDPTWTDFRDGHDSVLQWILAQPINE